jgi:hypothetical protein
MRRFALIAGLALLLTSCASINDLNQQPVTMIDWVNFIKFNGTTYLAAQNDAGRVLEQADLGPELAQVQFKVADNVTDPGYKTKDGDAAFLEHGTRIYTVKGYAPQMRLAAQHDGQITLYEADTNPSAKHGGDLLDLRDKVAAIGLNSMEDGTTEVGRIVDPQQIAALVELVLAAPVDQSQPPVAGDGQRYFVVFYFKDGTATKRLYALDSGELSRGIVLPPEFRTAIEAAVQQAPAVTPSPGA